MNADIVFWSIGLVLCCLVGAGVIIAAAFYLFAKLVYKRFHWIPFRKTKCRLSVASWHNTRIIGRGENPDAERFEFDDWPIRDRPFYMSYTVGKAQFFIMLGVMDEARWKAGRGKHPEKRS